MLYSISSKQYDVCFSTNNTAIGISTSNLAVNSYLYKTNNIDIWLWSQITSLDTSLIGAVNLYLKVSDSEDIIQIKQDITTGKAIITQVLGVCPTQTPTPTVTPSNTSTPTLTPSNTSTPSQTVTNTPSSTTGLSRFLYYISSNLETLCFNRYDVSVKAISIYDTDNILQSGSNIYKTIDASTKWNYVELTTSLAIPSNTPRIYLTEAITGIVYSIIPDKNGLVLIESEQVACPPMRISDNRYNLCHTNSYLSIQVNTTNLKKNNYLYKRDGVGKWTWSEIIGLNSLFPSLYTLYLKSDSSTMTLGVKEDIATGYVLIDSVDTACPTQTPTPTVTSTQTNTPTQTITKTSTSTQTPTQTMTGTPTSTATLTPTQTPTKTPTQTQTQTQTPTNSPTPTDPLNGSYYYLSDDSYAICHNNPSNLIIVYDQGTYLEVNDVLYQTSDTLDWYTMDELADLLGLQSLSTAYIRPVDNTTVETYRVRQVSANLANKASVTNIFQCVTPTPTATSSQTPTKTPTSTPSQTPTITRTPSQTPTNTTTSSVTPTQTITSSPTPSITSSQTATSTKTPTCTSTNTPTNTETITPTATSTQTPTQTTTPTNTASQTATPSETPTSTPTNTPTLTTTPTPSSTAVYIYEGINLNINNIITGNRYKVELITDDFGIAKPFPEEINFTGSYGPQRINFRLGFAANVSTVIVSAKITDLDTGRIEYNSVFIKCNSILDCY